MEWYIYPAIVVAGFLAGFINTIAGSGSLITLPLLMALGLPANVANGTNRIGILLQNVVGVASYRQKKVLDFKSSMKLVLPAVVGSVIGARIAVNLNEAIMEKTIGGLLLFMFFIVLWRPSRWLKEQQGKSTIPYWVQAVIFFLIGIYGGFIQAGVGFFLLAGLVLGAGYDLVKANAVKVLIVLLYTPVALAFFIYNHQVNFMYGFILAAGTMLGAWVGARVDVNQGVRFVRYFLLGT
ncbi:MAG TPA: sulfite exporter TauE/SafE family protein, partial [Bacteroidales bacterium]|nr:sulfite exporter TauE/SafE family protein [Bacteroidales bacterium]